METLGKMLTVFTRSAGTDSPGSRNEERATALQVAGKWTLSERKEEEEVQEGDLCSNILTSFINSLDDLQWESIRERMRDPLSQAHLAQVSRRIIRVVSELVDQVLVPALMVHLQAGDSPEASGSKSSKSSQEEETQSKASRSSPVIEMFPSSAGEALNNPWYDVERFLDPATGEVILDIANSLAASREMSEAGKKPERVASKILKVLFVKMKCSGERVKEKLDVISLDVSSCGCCSYLHKNLQKVSGVFKKRQKDEAPQMVIDGSLLQDTPTTYPMTVSFKDIAEDLSCNKFRDTSLNVLEQFLRSSLLMFSLYCSELVVESPEPSMDAVASEILDTVVNTVNQMCQPPPRKVTFPWHRSENITLSEDQVASTASALKVKLREMLRTFLKSHKEASDKLLEDKEERGSLSDQPSSRSDKRVEDTKEQSTEASSCESRVSMGGMVKLLLDKTKQLLRREVSGVKSGDATLKGLEELISQEKLFTFSKMMAEKLTGMFHHEEESLSRTLDFSKKAWSDSELIKPTRCPVGVVVPTDQVYVFVEEAVKCLLTSLIFPPPSWGMGHVIQVQSGASSAADWAASGEKFEDIIGVYSELMVRQVMESLDGTPAAARLQQEVSEPERKKSALRFFEELPNKIRSNWKTLADK